MKSNFLILIVLLIIINPFSLVAESYIENSRIEGVVFDETNSPMIASTVYVEGTDIGSITDSKGRFIIKNLNKGKYNISVSFVGYKTQTKEIEYDGKEIHFISFNMLPDKNEIIGVEIIGNKRKQPLKLESITRLPLPINEQIQTISVIQGKSIVEQGSLSVSDATKNVAGVTLFGSYGGVKESMSIRGYRGVPILKNGVRIDSDFRTGSALSDMQGVDNIQVIKGSAAINQGIGNDIGSAGGVINVVTKTPDFEKRGNISLRSGSWGELRTTFDVQSVFDKENKYAFRINGAFQRKDNYRAVINNERIYINPSFQWRPTDATSFTLEMDYLDDNQTPYTSSVNLSADDSENLYNMPSYKFLGFENDNVNNKTLTYSARLLHKLNDKYSVRASFIGSRYKVDNTSTSVNNVVDRMYNMRRRTISRSLREDINSTFQLDLVGKNVITGPFKHTFQLGADYKINDLSTVDYGSSIIDTIDVLAPSINNKLPINVMFKAQDPVKSNSSCFGVMGQDVMEFSKYLKVAFGLRYSAMRSFDGTSAGQTKGDAFNPMVGVMVFPLKNINIFASYTTTTSLRGADNKMADGTVIGSSTSRQLEFGIKSNLMSDRLSLNMTYFDIMQKNLSYATYNQETFQLTGYYDKAGNLKRKGIELELNGQITDKFQAILGYSYIDAKYSDSPAFMDGSRPMNTSANTANGWLKYNFRKGLLKNISTSVGIYYTGERPVNDWTLKMDGHGSMIGKRPFDMPAYSTVNAQIAYCKGNFTSRLFVNNIFNALGYNSYYRGGFINQIDPRNISGIVTYSF